MRPVVKKGLIITSFAVLAVVALVGWTRKTTIAPGASNYFNTPMGNAAPATPVNNFTPLPVAGAPANEPAPVVYGASPFGSSAPVAAPRREPVQRQYASRRATAVTSDSPRVVTRKRSGKKSAAIVAGSAAGGAAIGALAGGGKGAAIGALAGGAGGFVYDRLTREKREVVR